MPTAATDRNLLFGILAVQMDFASERDLIAAMHSWVLNKSLPLDEHLLAAGALTAETHQLLDALVSKHIEQHGGLAEQSLAAVSQAAAPAAISLRKELANLADADVQTSLARLPSTKDEAADSFATVAPAQSPPSGKDGRFTVVRPHAAGGLGRVSVARDGELNREVALKELLDRHADDPNSRERFLLEAEITGGLEHPGVVPIYALGQFHDGRPYYAMRFIRGDSLRQALERFHQEASKNWTTAADQLKLRRLLLRMIDVCHAIEYAHSRGVVHRDLKPGNIMLGQYGETLVVDWGLAKALGSTGDNPGGENSAMDEIVGPALSEPALKPLSGSSSAPTQMGAAVGTPAFMSPEQAAGRLNEVGPASDVFSLGATLYMVLTGLPPQTGEDLGEVLLRVQRGMFPKPREIKPIVPRPLEAICLKAMALQPAARYVSPRALAEDLESWLADEPVEAFSESLLSRGRRWVKNHRALVTSAVAAALVGLIVSWFAVIRLKASNDRETQSRKLAIAAKDKAIAAQGEASRQRRRVEQLLTLAKSSLEHYEQLSKSEQLSRYGMESLRSDLLETSVQYYATLANIDGQTEQARADRSNAYYRLGAVYHQKGEAEKSAQAYRTSIELYRQLSQEFPTNFEYRGQLASVYGDLGALFVFMRRAEQAKSPLAAAEQGFTELIEQVPEKTSFRRGLAYARQNEAERLRMGGAMDKAAAKLKEAADLLKSTDLSKLDNANDNDERREVRYLLSRVLMQLGALQSGALWKYEAAQESYQQASAIMQKIHDANPEIGNAGHALAQIKSNLGDLLLSENRTDEATQSFTEALSLMRAVEERFPEVPDYRRSTADLLNQLGWIHSTSSEEAQQQLGSRQINEAAAIARTLVDQYPEQAEDQLRLARYESNLGSLAAKANNYEKTNEHFNAATEILEKLAANEQATVDQLFTLGSTQYTIANLFFEHQQFEDSLSALEHAEASFNRVIAMAPNLGNAHKFLGQIYIARSMGLTELGRYVEGIKELDRVAAKSEKLSRMPDSAAMQAAFNTVAAGAKVARLAGIAEFRNGSLDWLLEQGEYQLAAEQAQAFAKYTGEDVDGYLAARTLAAAASQAANDPQLASEKQARLVEQYAAEAVQRLATAWNSGYLRQKSKLTDYFSAAPNLATLRQDEAFAALRERADFQALLKSIEAGEKPPQPEEEAKTKQPE